TWWRQQSTTRASCTSVWLSSLTEEYPMSTRIKFYQVGSFAVGNRLLDSELMTVQSQMDRTNALDSGHRACQGCGEALAARYVLDAAMRATGNDVVVVNATGCLEVFSSPYPESSRKVPWLHSLFGNAGCVLTMPSSRILHRGMGTR
ncbi:MAG: hypothetical protein ACP5OR_09285, partial [Candidatus Dormibacteria bacterium]